ncbi:polyprenyl synthetase family protein [Veronia pacifica]|uniref:Polyprenyl synthetase n=1 Tax=Veronia pacifica TaxID=1080227 RepID=A0A1C3EIF2_9GAMM|nr:polyprenyl synthetase family protein [Veronia pacifica]ODA33003.1 hypothetical protein A8L45_11960 [Veronia pacifica]
MTKKTYFSHIDTLLASVEKSMRNLVQGSSGPVSRVCDACLYHLDTGGKRNRARLALHTAHGLGIDDSDAVATACVSELLHNASLIHDDLQDHDEYRRDQKTVWKVFGPEVALCAGDLMISAAYGALATINRKDTIGDCLNLIHQRIKTVIHGQCLDLDSCHDISTSMAEYEVIAIGKSAPLLSLPVELVYCLSGHESWRSKARQTINKFALAYQITDDVGDVEEDLQRDHGSGFAPNAVLVLRNSGYGESAESVAIQRAQSLLSEVNEEINILPGKLDEIFCHYIRSLSDNLMEVRTCLTQ